MSDLSITNQSNKASAFEQLLIGGDLGALTAEQRVVFYNKVCDSLHLNPLTKPFDYIRLNGKLVLYAKRDATDQLRQLRKVAIKITDRSQVEDVYSVTAQASTPDGRTDESIGAVSIAGLKGEAKANAIMKAETKAKRRVTLSICGLGLLDELEVETIAPAQPEPAKQEIAPPKTETRSDKPSQAQIKRLFAIMHSARWTEEELKSYMEMTYKKSSTKDLVYSEYDSLCKFMVEHPCEANEHNYSGETPH